MAAEKSLFSGSTAMLLLGLLDERDMYGYEMIETLEQRSNHMFELKAGTLYPLLHSLEAKGFLTAYEKEAEGKRRKYYSVTKEGKRHLKQQKQEWQAYTTAVGNVLFPDCAKIRGSILGRCGMENRQTAFCPEV